MFLMSLTISFEILKTKNQVNVESTLMRLCYVNKKNIEKQANKIYTLRLPGYPILQTNHDFCQASVSFE